MTDREALLAAILANPAEDTPRLVFADWLEENSQPERAEFIRVQVELARIPEKPDCTSSRGKSCVNPRCRKWNRLYADKHDELRRRERELLETVPKWMPVGIDGTAEVVSPKRFLEIYELARGFVRGITCTWEWWVGTAERYLAVQPVERVRLTTRPDDNETWFEWDGLPNCWYHARWPRIAFELPPAQELWQFSHVQDPTNWDYTPVVRGDYPRFIFPGNV